MHFRLKGECMEIKWDKDTREHMKVKERDGVVYLTYPAFERFSWCCHGFSTRVGGVSQGIYSSMNLSFQRGDRKEDVEENYRRISGAIGFDLEGTVCSQADPYGKYTPGQERRWRQRDPASSGLSGRGWTDHGYTGDNSCHFFCGLRASVFVDPVHKAVGLAHSGWRGTAGGWGAIWCGL